MGLREGAYSVLNRVLSAAFLKQRLEGSLRRGGVWSDGPWELSLQDQDTAMQRPPVGGALWFAEGIAMRPERQEQVSTLERYTKDGQREAGGPREASRQHEGP